MAGWRGGDVVAQRLETDRGKLSIWLPAPTVFAHSFAGHFNAEFARALIAVLDRIYSRPGPIVFFNDWEGMTGYDSDARVIAMNWVRAYRERILGIHVLVRDRLVGMGVTVASLALGGIPTSYTDREAWEAALRVQIAEISRAGGSRPPPPMDNDR